MVLLSQGPHGIREVDPTKAPVIRIDWGFFMLPIDVNMNPVIK